MTKQGLANSKTLLDYDINSHKIASAGLKKIYTGEWLTDKKFENLLVRYIKLGREASLLASDFKCQRCSREDKGLQFHHLILRHNKEYINDKLRYLMQRNYWANIVILCPNCHAENHGRGKPNKPLIINAKLIHGLKDSRERYAKRKELQK